MLTIILVDDEPKVLRGLKTMIEHSGENWTVIGEFKNGVEALAAVINQAPDVIITDIKMPCMDGLELAERAKKILPGVRTIILSGFAEFSLAQQAIRLGSANYILKPPDYRDIIQSLQDIERGKEKMQRDEKIIFELDALKKSTILYEQDSEFADFLYAGRNRSAGRGEFLGRPYALFTIKSDHAFSSLNDDIEQLKQFSLFRKATLEAVHSRGGCVADFYDNSFCFLLNPEHSSELHLKNLAAAIRDEVVRLYGGSATIGVSHVFDRTEQLETAFQECLYLLRNKVFYEKNSILCISEITGKTQGMEQYPYHLERDYLQALEFADLPKALEKLNLLTDRLIALSGRDQSSFKSLIMEFILVVTENTRADRQNGQQEFSSAGQTYKELMKTDSIDGIREILADYTEKIVKYFESKNRSGCRRIINEIRAYIDSNYFTDLSLKQVSAMFHINESYLSDLFKKNIGLSFSAYISEVRIGRSKQLLSQADLKLGEIAEMVGYQNAGYFFKVFKKHTGLTPYEYREREFRHA